MPDLEISNLPSLAEASVQATDPLPIADLSASETKKITVKDLIEAGVALIDSASIPGAKVGTLGTNQVTTAAIQNLAVTTAKIANGAITVTQITDATITGAKLVNNTITATQIAANAIGTSELADNAVDTGAIANNAITNVKINNGEIVYAKLNITDGDIPAAKITGNSITSAQIGANAVGASELADDSVDTAAVVDAAITGAKIATDTIGSGNIAANAVGASELADNAVDTAAIASNAVTTAKIADDQVTAAKLANNLAGTILATGAIGSTQIAADAVTSSELADNAVDTAAIAASAVTDAKVASGISGTKISDGTITPAKLNSSNLNRSINIASGNLGINNAITAATRSGITYNAQGLITGTVALAASDLPLATTSAVGGVSIGAGLTVSGAGALSVSNSVTGATVSGITFNNQGAITAATGLVAGDLPTATTSAKGAVQITSAGGLSVDGSGNLTTSTSGISAGTYTKLTVNTKGVATAGTVLAASDIPSLDAAKITTGSIAAARIGNDTIDGSKLSNTSTAIFQSIAQSGYPTAQFSGQILFDTVSEDAFIWDGNAWQAITTLTKGSLVFGGTFNANTSKMTATTTAGIAAGLAVGSNLPTPSATVDGLYVICDTAGTASAPAPVVALSPPDYILGVTNSGGSSWNEIDLSQTVAGQVASNITFTPYGQLSATNVQDALQELETEKMGLAGGTVTGQLLIGNTGSLVFEGSTVDAYELTLAVADPQSSDKTITLPDITGTLITTGDTNTVTSTMVDGSLVNANLAAGAAIAFSKLAALTSAQILVGNGSNVVTGVAVTGDISINNAGLTAIASGVIVDGDISGSAAITGSKIATGTTSAVGVLQLTDSATSTSTTTAATPAAVKVAKDAADAAATTANAALPKAGGTMTDHLIIDNGKELRLSEADSDGAHYTGLKAQAQSSDITLTLPAVAPTTGQVLKSSSTATTLEWATDSATDATKLPLAGGTMSGAIAMGTSKITGLGDPTAAQDAATKTYVDTADALKLNLAGGTLTGNLTLNAQSDVRFADADSSEYVALQAPSTVGSSYTLTLPAADGTNGQALISDGSGNLSFTTIATGAAGSNTQVQFNNSGAFAGSGSLTFNSGTGALTATSFVGALTGNVTGNASGSSGSCTGNAATASLATEFTVTANNTADETVYPLFVDGATGSQGAETDTGLSYNPSSGLLTSTGFVGALTGNVTGNVSGSAGSCTGNAATATAATNVTVADESSDTTCFPLFATAATGDLGAKSGTNLTFNSSSGALTATSFVGALTGNVTGNASGSAATVTGAAQSAITSLGTLTGLTVDGDLSIASSLVHTGDTDTKISFASNTIKFDTDTSERCRIDSGGRLLIGTAANQHNSGNLIQAASASSTASIGLNRYSANAHPSYLDFFKSRDASVSGQTVVQDGDNLGQITWAGSDGTNRAYSAFIDVQVDGTPGDGDMPGRIRFSTSADGSESPTERMRIDSSGRVGIGVTPSHPLHLKSQSGSGNEEIKIEAESGYDASLLLDTSNGGGAGAQIHFQMDGTTKGGIEYVNNASSSDVNCMKFRTATNAERFQIGASGQLGVAGANYGTSGQVLTSGGASAAPSWTTVSAAPQITGTASGAIAANKPVIVHTDGTLKEVSQTITPKASATIASSNVFKTNSLADMHSDYDPQSQTTVVLYRNTSFGNNPGIARIQAIKYTAADATPTNGAQLDISWGANAYAYDLRYDPTSECMLALFNYNSESFFCSFTISGTTGTTESHDQIKAGATSSATLCPCPAAGKLFVFNAVGNRTEGWAYTNSGTGTSLTSWTHGDAVYLNGSSTGSESFLNSVYHSDSGKVVIIYRDNNDSDRLKSRVVSYDSSNNKLTFANSNDVTTAAVEDLALEYDPNANKLIALFRDNSNHCCFKIGTLSGTSITWGTKRTLQQNARYPKAKYTSIGDQIFISYADSSNRWSYKYGVISGTDITIGNSASGYLDSSVNAHDQRGGVAFDASIAAIVASTVQYHNGNYGATRTAEISSSTTNLTTGFAGFSDAAYSNGATATINVTGNTTTQSGLTAGSNYFVQNDGSLGTSAASTATVEAGLALSSTKLLIKG